MSPAMAGTIPKDWPNQALSRIIRGPRHLWHVQEHGTAGKTILLLHGAGGSTHSFRDMIPLLGRHCHVVAVDLPGHGFTRLGARGRSGLEAMAADIAALCTQEGWKPAAIIGHSAGAAIALRLGQQDAGIRIIGINPALGHFEGIAGVLFPLMAKVLAAVPFSARLFSGTAANPARIETLIHSTGSRLTAEGMDMYRRLVAMEPHVSGTLQMMAQWRLDTLLSDLPNLSNPVLFLLGDNDQTVPPRVGRDAAGRLPNAKVETITETGHLLHEERPAEIADRILDFLGGGA